MAKFLLRASETIYYIKEVEANSEEEARDMVFSGDVDFGNDDIETWEHFNLDHIDLLKEVHSDNDFKDGGFVNAEEERIYNLNMEGK
jgi:hypothetical protein